ncbi:hypothetical protein MIMGU_mgv1a024924mg [Erythranthe guttata]|uniref:Uncharacterized protein n=1 Tax=Erythranthe guttata TaxID=4155 RepID=A0A022Q1V3_ERYGU|nr:hypothetical protein MIMGU_mgv1a024924mg [Erythranthe guttata]
MPGRSSLCLHPIIEMIRDQELGKSVFNLGAPITVALLITKGGGKSHTVLDYCVLTGLLAGCVAIWNGISFRATFPHAANVVEQLGIIMVLMSFNGLVGSALPVDLAWVPVLCGGLSVLPFVVAALTPPPSEETSAVDNC